MAIFYCRGKMKEFFYTTSTFYRESIKCEVNLKY